MATRKEAADVCGKKINFKKKSMRENKQNQTKDSLPTVSAKGAP